MVLVVVEEALGVGIGVVLDILKGGKGRKEGFSILHFWGEEREGYFFEEGGEVVVVVGGFPQLQH